MTKIRGEGFSIRFARRKGARKTPAAQEAAVQEDATEMTMEPVSMMDIPEQVPEIPAVQDKSAQARLNLSLWHAARDGDCRNLRVLVMQGADLDARDVQGRNAINIAMQYNQLDAIKTLLAAREMKRLATMGDLPDTQFFRKFQA